ncbi:autotransporter domain-containing protein, partial [Acinetobacter baumannii]
GSAAKAVSADGTVVGSANNARNRYRAFRWTPATGLQDIGALPGFTESWAYDISADGSTIVGYSRGSSGDLATRWTNN